MTARFVQCRYCKKPLSDPCSRRVGYGADCAADRGLPHDRLTRTGGHGTPGPGQDALPLDPSPELLRHDAIRAELAAALGQTPAYRPPTGAPR